jgi:uncharacterized protein DUF2846
MKLKTVFACALLSMSACLAGCASRLAPPKADTLAKLMQPVEGKAVIYVFRNDPATAPKRIRVTLDGKTMGETSAQTYFRWEVSAGQHIIISYSWRWSGLAIDTEPGRIYYVWQDVGFFEPTSELKLVDRDTAEINLRSCYLLQSES